MKEEIEKRIEELESSIRGSYHDTTRAEMKLELLRKFYEAMWGW